MNIPQPIPFDASANWPEPDLTIARPSRPPATMLTDEEFSLIFGPWAEWLKTAASVKGAPVDYVALALLGAASAIIGNARWASPWEGWKEPPVLWAMLVGEPSAGKSPALDAVLDPIKLLERDLSEAYQAERREWSAKAEISALALAQWKADAKNALAEGEDAPAKPASADAGPQPTRARVSVSDITTEKLAEIMAATRRGLLQYRDELSGWLGGMDRYNKGGDRPFWLEAFGGRSFTVDRKNSPEPIIVDRLSVAVLGGTQPDKLSSLLVKCDDDGLLARFLVSFPDPVPIARPTGRIDEAMLKAALERLRGLPPAQDESGIPRPFFLPFTEGAAVGLHEFRAQCRKWETEASGIFKGHIGKLPGLTVRVSCVLAHLDWAATGDGKSPARIEAGHIGRACHLVGEHFRHHAYRAYGAADAPPEIRDARKLSELIMRDQPERVSVRDIQRRELAGLQKANAIEIALGVLVEADWLRISREETGGRPRVSYLVNPRLWGRS